MALADKIRLAVLLLVSGCLHEFLWQAYEIGVQGDVRSITQWGLICAAMWTIHRLAGEPFATAVCAALALMSSTTAGCSAYWLVTRFPTLPGQEQCSKQWGVPMMLISAAVALLVFWRWPRVR